MGIELLCIPPVALISTVSILLQLKTSLTDPVVLAVNACVWV
jgi:hypothetical protein